MRNVDHRAPPAGDRLTRLEIGLAAALLQREQQIVLAHPAVERIRSYPDASASRRACLFQMPAPARRLAQKCYLYVT